MVTNGNDGLFTSKILIFTVKLLSLNYKIFNEQKFIAMYKKYERISSELPIMNIEI
jgi:hypothetical protein